LDSAEEEGGGIAEVLERLAAAFIDRFVITRLDCCSSAFPVAEATMSQRCKRRQGAVPGYWRAGANARLLHQPGQCWRVRYGCTTALPSSRHFQRLWCPTKHPRGRLTTSLPLWLLTTVANPALVTAASRVGLTPALTLAVDASQPVSGRVFWCRQASMPSLQP